MSGLDIEKISKDLEILTLSHNKLQREFNQLLLNLNKTSTRQRISKPAKPIPQVDLEFEETLELNQFWEVVEKIGIEKLNHSKEKGVLALNLPQVYQFADQYNYKLAPKKEITKQLVYSKKYKLDKKSVVTCSQQRKIYPKSIWCWVFKI